MQAIALLWGVLTSRQRRQLCLTLLLMLAGAAAELLAIGTLIPFLVLLTDPDRISQAAADRLSLFGAEPAIVAAIIFSGAAALSAVLRLALTWHAQRFAFEVGQDLAARIFSRMLRQPFAEFVKHGSSEILSGIEKVQAVIFGVLMPVMQGFIAAFIALAITALLFFINAVVAAVAAAFLAGIYAVVSFATRRRLARNSLCVASAGQARIKTVQEGLGSIRDIILDGSQPLFVEKFRRLDARYREAQAATLFITAAPRIVAEAAAMAALSLIAVAYSFQAGGLAGAIPVLGALALAGQRLLPLIQQVFVGWTHASGNLQPLSDVIALAETPPATDEIDAAAEPLTLEREISFEAVAFSYGSSDFMLRNVWLTIRRGARIGIAGPTGSGKSTLLDLLMGLIEPASGTIRIDGAPLDSTRRRAWRAQIAHVPQSIYLLDDTIMANIAFGKPSEEVSMDEVHAAAAAAGIGDFIERLPQGYQTEVGERGIRLSGGQRQGLGIARALYRKAPVLILDEATNAMDEETEARVMRSIAASFGVTIVVVAHRISTLATCEEILGLEDGKLVRAQAKRAPVAAVPRP